MPPPAPADIRVVIFDLDGTLADTLGDIAAAGNHTLKHFGHPPQPTENYNQLAGQGLRSLIVDAFGGENAIDVDAAVAVFRAYYQDHKYDRTAPYAGIPGLLGELREAGLALAVLSNKPDDATAEMVDRLFPAGTFDHARGHRDGAVLKPDPASAAAVLAELGVEAARAAYVGDTDVDMQTGKRAGMFTVGVTWGFRTEAELRDHDADAIIHQPSQLTPLLR